MRTRPTMRYFVLIAALSLAPFQSFAAGPQITENALQQIRLLQLEKANRTPAQQKLSGGLLMAIKRSAGDALFNAMPELRSGRELARERILEVDMQAEVTKELLDAIHSIGGTIVNQHPKFRAIRARVLLTDVEYLAGFSAVSNIRPADQFMTNKINTSEGVVAHAADLVHASYDGTGTQTCVLSDGVDSLVDSQTSGDLPATVNVLAAQAGVGDEGTAMLEIVHDMAPGTNLWFATAYGGQAQFAQNILDLATAGCDIIVDDVFYFAEAAFQDGVIGQAINTVVDSGVQYYSSAGNSGNLNDGTSGVYEGDYVTGALPVVLSGIGSGAHDFGGGNTLNTITKDSPNWITLKWSDPMGGSSNDYDLFMLNPAGSAVFDQSTLWQNGSQDPYEEIDSKSFNHTNNILVIVGSGFPEPRFLRLDTNRGELAIATDGQTSGHGAAEKAFSVAAVDQLLTGGAAFDGSESVELLGSDGPRRIFYEPNGTAITAGDFLASGGRLLMKPDITAADGVATSAPGFLDFHGTSASAAHAAAIAALLLEKSPGLSREGTKFLFAATALDIEAAGADRDSGYGIIMADLSVAALDPTCTGSAPTLSTAVITNMLTCTGSTSVTVGSDVMVDSAGELIVDTPLASFNGNFSVALGGTLDVLVTP